MTSLLFAKLRFLCNCSCFNIQPLFYSTLSWTIFPFGDSARSIAKCNSFLHETMGEFD